MHWRLCVGQFACLRSRHRGKPRIFEKKLLRKPAPIFQLRMFQHPHIDPTSETLQKNVNHTCPAGGIKNIVVLLSTMAKHSDKMLAHTHTPSCWTQQQVEHIFVLTWNVTHLLPAHTCIPAPTCRLRYVPAPFSTYILTCFLGNVPTYLSTLILAAFLHILPCFPIWPCHWFWASDLWSRKSCDVHFILTCTSVFCDICSCTM